MPTLTLNFALVLYLYDFILTLESEIKSIWQRKFSGLTCLFLISRYGFLVYLFLITVPSFLPGISLRVSLQFPLYLL